LIAARALKKRGHTACAGVRSAANKSVNGITRANINSLLMLGAFSLLISSLVWQLKNSSASAAADSFLFFSLSYLALPCFGSDCSLSRTHTLTHTPVRKQKPRPQIKKICSYLLSELWCDLFTSLLSACHFAEQRTYTLSACVRCFLRNWQWELERRKTGSNQVTAICVVRKRRPRKQKHH
jgi:hypothetical protein